jgi:undecaprenyl-diphosphatase
MTFLQVCLFSLVEGLSEFLPISSTAHLLLLDHFSPVANRDFFAVFSVFIQAGAMLAVLAIFLRQLWQAKNIWFRLLIAIIPTLILGLIFNDLIENYLKNATAFTGWALLTGGVFFSLLDYLWRKRPEPPVSPKASSLPEYASQVATTSYPRLALLGVAQAVAMIPGVSRSAATIFGARALGFSKMAATKLSFILGLPTIAGASALVLIKQLPLTHPQTLKTYSVFNSPSDLILMLTGAFISFLAALATAKLFIKLLGAQPFYYWGIYRLFIGLIWLLVF